MAKFGHNFRETEPFVTDGADDDFVGVDFAGTSADARWVDFTGTGDIVGRNRLDTLNPKLAGHNRCSNAIERTFDSGLPAGSYYVRAAAGDNDSAQTIRFRIHDGTTDFVTVAADTSDFNRWLDAGGNEHDEASWVSSNTRVGPFTFAASPKLTIGDGAASGVTTMNHVEFEEAGGGGSVAPLAATMAMSRRKR